MSSKFMEDPTLCALLGISRERNPHSEGALLGMPSEDSHNRSALSIRATTAPTQSTARCSVHRLCPGCSSRMVRSRDLRDMCVVCGYLQAQA